MARREVFIDCDSGEVVYLNDAATDAALSDVCGEQTTARASHVEPTAPAARFAFHLIRRLFGETGRVADLTRSRLFGPWRVNLAPVGGPILPTVYRDRSAAIAAEIQYLNDHPELWV